MQTPLLVIEAELGSLNYTPDLSQNIQVALVFFIWLHLKLIADFPLLHWKKALQALLQTITKHLQVIKHLKALHLTYLLAIKHTPAQMHYLRQMFEIWMNVWIFSFKYSW